MLLVVMCVWLITIPSAPLLNLPCFPSTQNISICQISVSPPTQNPSICRISVSPQPKTFLFARFLPPDNLIQEFFQQILNVAQEFFLVTCFSLQTFLSWKYILKLKSELVFSFTNSFAPVFLTEFGPTNHPSGKKSLQSI